VRMPDEVALKADDLELIVVQLGDDTRLPLFLQQPELLRKIDGAIIHQSRCTHMAMPMPPPMQRVARPFLASRFCISCSSVTNTRAPEAPTGCPMAIAPPLTLTLEVFHPRSLLTAQACAAKA